MYVPSPCRHLSADNPALLKLAKKASTKILDPLEPFLLRPFQNASKRCCL